MYSQFLQTSKKFLKLISKTEKKNIVRLIFLLSSISLIEVIGVASIFPFLAIVSNPEVVFENNFLNFIYLIFEKNYKNFNINSFMILLGLVSFTMILLSNILRIYSIYKVNKFNETIRHNISLKLLTKYIYQPYEYFTLRHTSELTKNVMSEIDFLIINVLRPVMQMISYLFVLVSIILLLLLINPLILITAILLIIILYYSIYLLSKKRIAEYGDIIVNANKKRFNTISDALNGIKFIKMQDIEHIYSKEYEKDSLRYIQPLYKFQTIVQSPKFFLEALVFGAAIIIITSILVMFPTSTINDYIPLIGLYVVSAYKVQPGINALYEGISSIRYGHSVIKNLSNEFKTTKKIKNLSALKDKYKMQPKKEIYLKNISFKYKTSKNIINKFNLRIKVGDNLGLFGLSGSGKTTLLDLISGLNLPSKGNIYLDGKKINSKNILHWRSCIDYIQQEIFIKEGSFAENIAFGIPKNQIDYDKVFKCAKIACIHDFIVNFKKGYDEKVGERGNRISGGQNQRIGIARALYKDPDILILDEATNALDSKTEKKVIKSLCKHMTDKTMIIVSHKLDLLEYCDNIIFLENGKIQSNGQNERIKSLIKKKLDKF